MMKENKVVYMAGKPRPTLDEHPELRNRLCIMPDGVTHISTAFVKSLTDEEFAIVCMLPFTFAMDEATLMVVQNRIERQGIGYTANVKQKSIHTSHGTETNNPSQGGTGSSKKGS